MSVGAFPFRPVRSKARAGRVFHGYIADCGLVRGSQMDGLADWRTATSGTAALRAYGVAPSISR